MTNSNRPGNDSPSSRYVEGNFVSYFQEYYYTLVECKLDRGKWFFRPTEDMEANECATWLSEADETLTGTAGMCKYFFQVGDNKYYVVMTWDAPQIGENKYSIEVEGPNGYYGQYHGGEGDQALVRFELHRND